MIPERFLCSGVAVVPDVEVVMDERAFPIEMKPDDNDPRFTFGFILDVAAVLRRHGFPDAADSGADFVGLRQALFGFLYRVEGD